MNGGAASLNGPVSVVVIAYNDAEHLGQAVTSALAQGEAVGEVVVVDDCSTDATGAVADRLAAANPRVRVVHRAENSGGCGTPRNDGVAAARGSWIAFLDSDDVLPTGAVDALLRAAEKNGADVAAGLCTRLELPDRREMPWQPQLFETAGVFDGLGGRPETVWDTLSVNKLYRRDFLLGKGIRFPDGSQHYEDFTFSARVYAAAPRFAVVPRSVYVWHTRPGAANPSISLRRDRVTNWTDRIAAHRGALEALRRGGEEGLARAAELKFAAYDVPMYLRDLHRRPAEYRNEWWRTARELLGSFTEGWLDGADPATRWRTAVLLGREDPAEADLGRLAELSAVPPRLAPPAGGGFPGADAASARWDEREPAVPLAGLAEVPAAELPLCVTADVRPGRRLGITLRLAELYGRVREAGPETVTLTLRHRRTGAELRQSGAWRPAAGPGRRARAARAQEARRAPGRGGRRRRRVRLDGGVLAAGLGSARSRGGVGGLGRLRRTGLQRR
ncbi:glycosyltransferase family 2 protein [Phaeacidiphilus oryzae]|uniref:glycosyltransferase family 2 protein n=1 Tax=Phaeacidiphilus oryzae TaxID=348818 RepID=UPI001F407AB9|nr:glycosyltransferase family 2 protein [Phaeacidiphilus oryzae]